ncbi:MAG: hypothetical protein Q8P42_07985 [Gallionella sp.]|nr:hypothetical protein [Gallionella sp.]
MPTISAFFVIVIQMFWREHAPPHFHAIYAEIDPVWLYDNLSDGKSCPLLTQNRAHPTWLYACKELPYSISHD